MDKKRIELKKKQMLDKRRAKQEEIQKRKAEMESNLGLQSQFFDQLISRVQQPTFLTNMVDMNLASCFVDVLKDTKTLQKTQYEFMVPFLPVIAWQLANVDLSWTLIQPQNNHQQLEHITNEILKYSCRIIKAINSGEIHELYIDGINNYIVFRQIQVAVSILCGYSEDFSYIEVMQMFTAYQNICYPLFEVSKETTEKMHIAVESVLHETIPKQLKPRIPDALPEMNSVSLKSLLHSAVADGNVMEKEVMEEKGRSVFIQLVEKNQTLFNWELLSVGAILHYCKMILEQIDKNEEKTDEITYEQRVGKALRMVRGVLNFIKKFEIIEPTCVGDVVLLAEILVVMHEHLCQTAFSSHTYCDYLCECLFNLSIILKQHIGNPVVHCNLEAYIAAKLFGSLFSKEQTLTSIIDCVQNNKEVPLPCLHSTALAFTFSRDIFSLLQSNKTTIVDPSTYKNYSRIPCELEVYSHKIDIFRVNTFEQLTELILSPNGVFLDTLFALLLTSFIGIGYEEAKEKLRLKKFDTDEEMKIYQNYDIDYELTRLIPLYLAVYIFSESPCKALKDYVKRYFSRQHIDSLWFIIVAQSPRTSLNNDNKEPFGPLVSDPESITNLRVLLKQLVNNRHITDTNLQILLEKRRENYPLVVPVELAVFTTRLWIHRISSITILGGKDDPIAVKEWDVFIAALEKLIASTEEWKGEECVGYETVCLMLFIFHNLSKTSRVHYVREIFKTILKVPANVSAKGCVGLTRLMLLLEYTLRYHDDFSIDLLNELKSSLLSRSFEEHGDMMHDTCIIPAFIEKLNYSDALYSFAMETHKTSPPPNGYIRFYAFTKYETYDQYLSELRLNMHYPIGTIVILFDMPEYTKVYEKLLNLLRDCVLQPPKNPALQSATFILNEYFFNSLWMVMCLLPPPQTFIDQFKDKNLFVNMPIGNLFLHYVSWMTNLIYITTLQKSRFYKGVDIANMRIKEHVRALVDVLKKIQANKENKSLQRTDAIVETIIQFLTCASLNSKYLDLYRAQLSLRKMNDADAMKIERLTQTDEDKKKFANAMKQLKKEEEEKKKKSGKKDAKMTEDLKSLQNEKDSLLKSIKSHMKADKKNEEVDHSLEELEVKMLDNQIRRKKKIIKKRNEWAEPVNSPDKLQDCIKDVIYKNMKDFFEVCGGLLQQYVTSVKTHQLGGIVNLDRGIIVDKLRGNDVNWKKDAIISVLFEGISDESLKYYITEMVLTDETIEFVCEKWGKKLYLWKDEFFHPLQHILDASVSCPIRPQDRAYFATVSSNQKIVKSIITLASLISIQSGASGMNYENSSLMNTLLTIIPDKGFKYTQERAIELANKITPEKNAFLLMEQSKLNRGDQFLNFVLNKEKVDEGTIECVLDCLSMMEQATKTIKEKTKKIDYYLGKLNQFGKSDMKLYLLIGGKVKDRVILRRIEEFLQQLMEGDEQMKSTFSKALLEWKNPQFGDWCIQKIIGTQEKKKFVESTEKESKELFDFFEKVIGKEEKVKIDNLEKLIESVPLVVENHGSFIRKYFRTIFAYVSKQNEGRIIVEGIMKWFRNIPIEKIKALKENEAFSELLHLIYYLFCQIKEQKRRLLQTNYLPDIPLQPLQCTLQVVGKKPFMQKMFSAGSRENKKYLCVACSECCVEHGQDIEYIGMVERSCQCEKCKCTKAITKDNRQEQRDRKQINNENERLFEIDSGKNKSEVKLDDAISKSIQGALKVDKELGKQLFTFLDNLTPYMLRAISDEIQYFDGLFKNQIADLRFDEDKNLTRELLTKEQLQLNATDEAEDDFFISTHNIFTYDGLNRLYRVVDESNLVRDHETIGFDFDITSIEANKHHEGILLVSSLNTVDIVNYDEGKVESVVKLEDECIIHKMVWLGSSLEFGVFTDKFVRVGKYEGDKVSIQEYTIDSIIYSGELFSYSDRQYILVIASQHSELYMHIIDRPLKHGVEQVVSKHISYSNTRRETFVSIQYLPDIDAIALSSLKNCVIGKLDTQQSAINQHFFIPNFAPSLWLKLPNKRSFYMTYNQKNHVMKYISFKKESVCLSDVLEKHLGGIALEPRTGSVSVAIVGDNAILIDYIPEPVIDKIQMKTGYADLTKLTHLRHRYETDNSFFLRKEKKVYYNRIIITNLNEQMVMKVVRLHFKSDTIPLQVLVNGRDVGTTNRGNVVNVVLLDKEIAMNDPRIEITLLDCVTEEHLPYPSKIETFGLSKNEVGFNELKIKAGMRETGEQLPLIMPIHHIYNSTLLILLRYFELNFDAQTKEFVKEVQEFLITRMFESSYTFVHDQIMKLLRYLSSSQLDLKQSILNVVLKEGKSLSSRHSYSIIAVLLLKIVNLIHNQPNEFKKEEAQNTVIGLVQLVLQHVKNTQVNRSSMVCQACKLIVQLLRIRSANKTISEILIDYLSDEKYGNVALDALTTQLQQPLKFAPFNGNLQLKLVSIPDVNRRLIDCLVMNKKTIDEKVFMRVAQLMYVTLTANHLQKPGTDLIKDVAKFLIDNLKMFKTNHLIALHTMQLIRCLIRSFDTKAYESFMISLKTMGEVNFMKGVVLLPSVELSEALSKQLDCDNIEDVMHDMIEKEIKMIEKEEMEIVSKDKHHTTPFYKTKEMRAVDLTVDILQTLFYLQVNYKKNQMNVLHGNKWSGILEEIIELETDGHIARGFVSKQLLYELSGSSYLYHQATDKKKYETIEQLDEDKERKEIITAIIKIAKIARKRPAHWQKHVSEKPSLIQLLMRWVRSEINDIVLPSVQLVQALFISEVKMKTEMKETEVNEMGLINKDLSQMNEIRRKIGIDFVQCRGISDVIRMTGYDKNEVVRKLLAMMFKTIYRDSNEVTQKKLWGFFKNVLEHPQSDVLNKEFISTMKLFSLINECNERKMNIPIHIDTSL